MRYNLKIDRRVAWGIIVAMAAVHTFMMVWSPWQLDDFVFLALYHDYSGGSDEFSFEAFYGFVRFIRRFDNQRLANISSPLSTAIRPWCTIFPYLTGLVSGAILLMVTRLWQVKRNYAMGAALAWLLIATLLPWHNDMYVRDYALNYVYGSAITLAFVVAVSHCEHTGWRKLTFAGCLLFSLVAGGWHEGFAVPTCAGLGAVAFLRRHTISRQWWAITVTYGLTIVAFLWCPGVIDRISDETLENRNVTILQYVIDNTPAAVVALSIAVMLMRSKWRRYLRKQLNDNGLLVILVAMAVSCAISLSINHTPRMSLFPTLCAIIVTGRLLAPQLSKLSLRKSLFIGTLSVALCLFIGILSLVWQHRIYVQAQQVECAMRKSPTGTTFIDVIKPYEIPWYTLDYPSSSIWQDGWGFIARDMMLRRELHTVIPTSLAHRSPTDKPLPSDPRIMTNGDALYMHNFASDINAGCHNATVTLRDGTRQTHVRTLLTRFVNLDGDTLIYVQPQTTAARNISDLCFDTPDKILQSR